MSSQIYCFQFYFLSLLPLQIPSSQGEREKGTILDDAHERGKVSHLSYFSQIKRHLPRVRNRNCFFLF